MPLSEHEQRLLEEMEKQLHADPQFADSLRKAESAGRYSTRNIAIGLLIAVAGLAVVLVGISLSSMAVIGIVVGVLGFFLMCFGVYLALSKRGSAGAGVGGSNGPAPASPKRSSYLQRLEQEWEDRRKGEHN
ncbi:MAG: DUF3040 domain-containing protein [Arthrobacter sp.]|jgi:hypothetical protein|nr:DUF3040 domain-containing protein [Arthrobacter sp.]